MAHTWHWEYDGLYDGVDHIIWPIRDYENNLYVGVMADWEYVILAAPELLAACKAALDELSGPDRDEPRTMAEKMAERQLRAAIAKANGDST